MAMEQEKKQSGEGGIGLGVGIDLNVRLNLVKELVHTLNSALQETTGTVTGILSDVYHKIREAGPEKLKSEAQQGGYEDQYNELVQRLNDAADRGEEEARSLLNEMGETWEESRH